MTKYGNQKIKIDGFDSRREANRYLELRLLERARKIRDLELQKEFELIPAQYDGKKCVERACKYRADFYYFDIDKNAYVCEDTKGMRTKDYIIKRKLMLQRYGIRISEI